MTYFRDRELDEIPPVWRAVDEAHPAFCVPDALIVETAVADVTQQVMKLVDGEHGGRRVVDCRRQPLVGNIDDDPKRERRVLLNCALGAEGNGLMKRFDRNDRTAVDA